MGILDELDQFIKPIEEFVESAYKEKILLYLLLGMIGFFLYILFYHK